ncbi:MAG: hypothetical protein MJA82_06255 [Clostridia bacterium]|nr:hypothetical protein [Clostridia bacterium]
MKLSILFGKYKNRKDGFMKSCGEEFFIVTKNVDFLAVLKLPRFNEAIAKFIQANSSLNIYHIFKGDNILLNNEDIFDFTKIELDEDEEEYIADELYENGNFHKEKIKELTNLLNA